ncbi:hypothetical protein AaE_010417 [Aphanomyces astaci]|uniref:Uncharacterized protein n=1 Tax=Aphanomyces astaci TaxID=112090 RepID=A0A6A5A260_APHAT|nr:hypothetical protein AaE_010417 [Aphanomyces astaci]
MLRAFKVGPAVLVAATRPQAACSRSMAVYFSTAPLHSLESQVEATAAGYHEGVDIVNSQTQALSHIDGEVESYSERVHVVSQLQRQGYSAVQAQGLVDAMKSAFSDSIDVQVAVVTTKAEHMALKSEILEHVFNSTLKFGTPRRLHHIAQRNMRDFLEHDFVTLKQDIHMMEKLDFEAVRNEIAQVEAKFKGQKDASDDMFANLVKSNARLEKRVLNYVMAFGSTIAIILGVLGSIIEKH